MRSLKIGSMYIDVKSMLFGALALAVVSALPVVGATVTNLLNTVRNTVAGLFTKKVA